MTNDELKRRLLEGHSACSGVHEAHREETSTLRVRYWLTCDDETRFEVVLDESQDPAPWFERWSLLHEKDVLREHLLRVLEGGEITPTWRENVEERLAALERLGSLLRPIGG